MKKKILIVLLLVSSTLCFAEPEIESEWDSGDLGLTIFYKDKTFTIINTVNSGNVSAIDGFLEMISKGTFEGDTTKDGDIRMSLTSATMKGDFNGIEMDSNFDITEDGLFNCTCKVNAMGTSIAFTLKEGKDGLLHGTCEMDGNVQTVDATKYEIFGDAFYYLDILKNTHWHIQGDSLLYGNSNQTHRVK